MFVVAEFLCICFYVGIFVDSVSGLSDTRANAKARYANQLEGVCITLATESTLLPIHIRPVKLEQIGIVYTCISYILTSM